MVNFKGGGHQGEHKRSLAAQGGEQAAVGKLEKLALRKDGTPCEVDGPTGFKN